MPEPTSKGTSENGMKIKAHPRDFIVEEILGIRAHTTGSHRLLKLTKQGLNTSDALRRIASQNKLSLRDIGYGGRKDKHAHAVQYITIKSRKPPRPLKHKDLSLDEAGWLNRPMGPDLIAANHFRITVRDLTPEEIKNALIQLDRLGRHGFFNYFDDQRFGPFDALQGFLAEKIIKKHFNGALKFFITHAGSEDRKPERERKKRLFSIWGHWDKCADEAVSDFERTAFARLKTRPGDFTQILRAIPADELGFHFASYQSFLWNEILRRLVLKTGEPVRCYPGTCGDYLFSDRFEGYPASLPTASSRMDFADPGTKNEYARLFEEQGIKASLFNVKKIRQAYFKSASRQVLSMPETLRFSTENDDLHENKNKLLLQFSLRRGSYATMLIKNIFASGKT